MRKPRHRRRTKWARRLLPLCGVALAALVAAGASLLLARSATSSSPALGGAPGARGAGFPEPAAPRLHVAPWTLLATPRGPTPGYESPGSPAQVATIPATWSGAPSVLPVLASARGGWLEVRVLQRQSGQTAWVRSSDVSLTRTQYHVVVDLSSAHLLLYRRGRLVLSAPAGIGTAAHPTPQGSYFVALVARSPSAAYGPFVIVTSAFAGTLTDWEQQGNPMITIHGPAGSAALIGRDGSEATQGSVRLLDRDLERLAVVPAGTPVDVVDPQPRAEARADVPGGRAR